MWFHSVYALQEKGQRHPKLGDDVLVGAGVIVLGEDLTTLSYLFGTS